MNNLKPNKQLGQHWLHDRETLRALCEMAMLEPGDTVLEIGPGLGTLTIELAQRVKQVVAVELDAVLADDLQKRLPKNVKIIQGDILQFDLSQLPARYKVVANVPYYITSKITRLLLESSYPPELATLLLQKEVAERMAAQPGDMSILAVAVQFYSEVALGPIVPSGLFTPPPQVDSQIITLRRRTQPRFPDVDTKLFFRIVRAGFGEKRKQLRNSLSGGLRITKMAVEAWLHHASIQPEARAEELSLDDWHQLVKLYGVNL